LDGVSLVPLLMRSEPPAERGLFWRIGDRRAARRGVWKLVISGGESPRLFNLRDDPGEARDLAAARPDLVKRLTDDLTAWERRVEPRKHADPS
jgi:arylsulfatase A-like enzyme